MFTLFEYSNHPITIKDRKSLEGYLSSLWKEYKNLWLPEDYENLMTTNSGFQPFLSFDCNQSKANNFIGFINCNEDSLKIYPKVFNK